MLAAISGGAAGLNALRYGLAVNTLSDMLRASASALALADGWADEYEDATGIDAANSTGETYDAAGDYYHNPAGYGSNLAATATLTGSSAAQASHETDKAVDGNGATYWVISGATATVTLQLDFGAAKTLTKAAWQILSGSGTASNAYFEVWDGASWVALYTLGGAFGNSATYTWTFANSTASTRYRFRWTYSGSNTPEIAEISVYETAPASAMALVSETITADAAPGGGYALALVEEVDALTVGTDITISLSADDGATWSAVALSDYGTVDFGGTLCRVIAGAGAFGGAGVDLRYKLSLASGKGARIHGFWLQWS